MKQNVPPHRLGVVLPLSGAFSQTSVLNYLGTQGSCHPCICFQGFSFPRRTLHGQKEVQCCQTHTANIRIEKTFCPFTQLGTQLNSVPRAEGGSWHAHRFLLWGDVLLMFFFRPTQMSWVKHQEVPQWPFCSAQLIQSSSWGALLLQPRKQQEKHSFGLSSNPERPLSVPFDIVVWLHQIFLELWVKPVEAAETHLHQMTSYTEGVKWSEKDCSSEPEPRHMDRQCREWCVCHSAGRLKSPPFGQCPLSGLSLLDCSQARKDLQAAFLLSLQGQKCSMVASLVGLQVLARVLE